MYLDEEIFVFVEPHRLDEVVSLEVDDKVWLKGWGYLSFGYDKMKMDLLMILEWVIVLLSMIYFLHHQKVRPSQTL